MGSPNVPPGIASRIVQIDAAHAAIQTVVAITANKADSRRNKEHQAVLPIPYPIRLGSPNVRYFFQTKRTDSIITESQTSERGRERECSMD